MNRLLKRYITALLGLVLPLSLAVPANAKGTSHNLITITQVVTGDTHACALRSDGKVMCWGKNDRGQVGNGTLVDQIHPVLVKNLVNVAKIVAGGAHTCALRKDGKVFCWGANNWAQIGTYSKVDVQLPKGVDIAGRATAIGASGANTCVILTTKAVKCWGAQLVSAGPCPGICTAPMFQPGMTNVTQMWVGTTNMCAKFGNGTIKCAGSNAFGQLQTANQEQFLTLSSFTALPQVKDISLANADVCAVLPDNQVSCWGYNSNGQLGNGNTNTVREPAVVLGLGAVKSLSSGPASHCAVLSDATVSCWGQNTFGQLGVGSYESAVTPAVVPDLSGVKEVSAGTKTCALRIAGAISCWGFGSAVGPDGLTLINSNVPVPVTFSPDPVTGLKAVAFPTRKAILTWASGLAPRPAVVKYSVAWRLASSKQWSAIINVGTTRAVTIAGMQPGKKYAVEITATNKDVATTQLFYVTPVRA